MDSKKHTAAGRKVQAHPTPKYHSLIEAFGKANDMRRGKVLNHIIRAFFDGMSPAEIERIRVLAKNC